MDIPCSIWHSDLGGDSTMTEEKKKYCFEKPVWRLDMHTHLRKPGLDGVGLSIEERKMTNRVLEIDRCVILPDPFNGTSPQFAAMMRTEDARLAAQKDPEHFLWFCNLIPDGTERTREALACWKQMGAKGFGEFGPLLPFDDPKVDHLLGCCEELGLPFLFHISPEGTNAYGVIDHPGLPLLEKALQRHPGLIFIAHSQPFWYELAAHDPIPAGMLNGFPFGKVEREGRAVELLRKYPNLYADLSANSGANAILRDPDYGVRFLHEFQDRLFFGTDQLDFHLLHPLASMLDYFLFSGQLDGRAYANICRLNALRVLGLSR